MKAASDGPGRGSEFVVRLILAPSDQLLKRDAVVREQPIPSQPQSRILVVDDNVDGADSLAVLLRLGGHEVSLAHDGPAALEMAQAFRPEVVLLDIGLPGMDGYEVAKRLRTRDATRNAVLVAVTGYGRDEDQHIARRGIRSPPGETHQLRRLERHFCRNFDAHFLGKLTVDVSAAKSRQARHSLIGPRLTGRLESLCPARPRRS